MKLLLLHSTDARPDDQAYQDDVDELNESTRSVAEASGWEVELLASADAPLEETLRAVREADAIVLMGGEDVDPELFGGASDYQGRGRILRDADDAHIAAVRAAVQQGTPLLGICRGLQVINVALGGTLIQHLETTPDHCGTGDGRDSFVPGTVEFADDAELRGDVPSLRVFCSHHQAVDRPGSGLKVVARAKDGVVEAVVHETAPVTGVQWHPEFFHTAPEYVPPLLERLARQAFPS